MACAGLTIPPRAARSRVLATPLAPVVKGLDNVVNRPFHAGVRRKARPLADMRPLNDESSPSPGKRSAFAPMRLQFSTEATPGDEARSLLQDGVARTGYRVTLGARRDDAALSAKVDICVAGGISLAAMTTNLVDVARTRSDVAADSQHWFVVYRVRDAPQEYTFRNQQVILRPGDVGIGARTEMFRAMSRHGFAFDQLLAPAAAVRPLLAGDIEDVRIVPGGAPMAVVIGSAMNAAMQTFEGLPEPLADGVLRNILSLATLAAGSSEEGREAGRAAVRAQQLEAARRCIEQRLADPDLSPAIVAAALRISLRSLHALFEPTGESFARYVLRRRLERCHASLRTPGASRLGIADLAFACGFNSLATFNRAFQLRFGQSPSDVRDGAQAGELSPIAQIARNEKPWCAR